MATREGAYAPREGENRHAAVGDSNVAGWQIVTPDLHRNVWGKAE
jgi:hypothetical protein